MTARSLRHGLALAALIVTAGVVVPIPRALATCATSGTNQNCSNPAGTTVSGGGTGISDNATLTLNNAGTVSGTTYGVFTLGSANVTNSGTIFGANQYGIRSNNDATIVNSGTISSASTGIAGIYVPNNATITNSGTISGPRGIIAGGGGIFVINNSGSIIGTNGSAIDFSASSAGDTLNFLPGSRIVGNIDLGSGDTVNIHSGGDIAWLLTFGACGCGGLISTGSSAFVTGGAPYVINGDQVATLDGTAFGLSDVTLLNFTGFISSLLGNRFGEFGFAGTAAPVAFAPTASGVADGASAAFGNIPGLGAYAADTRMPNATAVDRASGIAVWSKGFAGLRKQDPDGPNLAATMLAYGGIIGADKQFSAQLRLGAFLGAGNSRLNVDLSSQTVKTDYVFAGVYGRYDWSTTFLDFAVTGGHTANASDRLVANNLAPNGLETASGSYNGWFVSPELAYGVRVPLSGAMMLTPAARLRYLAGFFDGYSETGSAQNLSVSSRTTQNVEERLELALTRVDPLRQGFVKTTATVGVLGMERLGDTTINTVLIGQNLSFAAPGRDSSAGLFAGLSGDYRVTNSTSLFAAAEVTASSDKSRSGVVQGGVRVAF